MFFSRFWFFFFLYLQIEKWFKKADSNRSGFISYREFSKSTLKEKYKKVQKRRYADEVEQEKEEVKENETESTGL